MPTVKDEQDETQTAFFNKEEILVYWHNNDSQME